MVTKLNSCKPNVDNECLLYGKYTGHDDLKDEIADLYNRHFKPLKPVQNEHVLVTNGCASAINSIAQVCTDAGDGILIPCKF